jgi:GDP-4-dehydro-6-deoxy-D-mannose reductase
VKRRYLITGAQGLVGRYLTARILETEPGSEVLGIGRSDIANGFFTHSISMRGGPGRAPLPARLLASFSGRHRYRPISLLDAPRLRDLLRELQPDCVFHLASALHTASERDLLETNVEGTASLMNAVGDALGSEALVILGSSGSVYGEPDSLPIRESDACNPADMYGLTKLAAEHVVRIRAARCGFSVVMARIFNVVGPGQSESHVCARLASQLASLVPSSHAALEVGALDTTRDFIDVRDVAAALLLLAQRGERGNPYNLASGRETPIQEILCELLRISGLSGQVEIVRRNDRPAGVRRHVADVSRLQRLGFAPAYSIGDSLGDLFRYHRAQWSAPSSTAQPEAAH